MAKLSSSNMGKMNNIVINGDFTIWQRGTSFAAIANGTFHADRFEYLKNGTMVHTVSRSTDVPTQIESEHTSNYSMLTDCTTADVAIDAGHYCMQAYRVEGYDLMPAIDNYVTLSFWVKATKTGIHCIGFRCSGSDASYVTEYTINTTNTWEKKTVTLLMDDSVGTWDYTNGIGISMYFVLACGSTFQTTADAWQSGNYFATSNQVNVCDNVANDFQLAQVKLELGPVATRFTPRLVGEEQALCERYYEKSYDLSVAPGTADTDGMWYTKAAAAAIIETIYFKTRKRTDVTFTVYSPDSGTAAKVYDYTDTTDLDVAGTSPGECSSYVIVSVGVSDGDQIGFNWTADAEL